MATPWRPPRADGPDATKGEPVYLEFPPPAELRAVLVCTWTGKAGWPQPLNVLPDSCLDIVWDGRHLLAAPAVAGPVQHYAYSNTDSVGVRVRPGWAAVVLGMPVMGQPAVSDLPELLPGVIARAEEQLHRAPSNAHRRALLAQLVVDRLGHGRDPQPRLLGAVQQLAQQGMSVRRCAADFGISVRQLRRWFEYHVGPTPTEYRSIVRFRRFLHHLDTVRRDRRGQLNLADIAAACGYADQSHLHRECRRWAKVTPGDLATAQPPP